MLTPVHGGMDPKAAKQIDRPDSDAVRGQVPASDAQSALRAPHANKSSEAVSKKTLADFLPGAELLDETVLDLIQTNLSADEALALAASVSPLIAGTQGALANVDPASVRSLFR